MCGCIFAIFAVLSPRLAFVFLWIFTNLVTRAFDTFIIPLLGVIFVPFTSLVYVLVYSPSYGVSTWGWFWVVLALLLDLASYAGSAYGNKDRLGY